MSLSLDLPLKGICVGGQIIRGVAELYFPHTIEDIEDEVEEVHVQLRGVIQMKIEHQYGGILNARYRHKIEFLNENQSLWMKGSNDYPPSGSQVLRIPFEFTLPEDLLPSCVFDKSASSAIVGYFVELVGVRSGIFPTNQIIRKVFPVVPKDTAGEVIIRSLRDPVLNLSVQEKKIRRGFFGEYAHVRSELVFPDVPFYPLFTPIQYTLHVTTLTKPMTKAESDKFPDKANFPSPPINPEDVHFCLRRHFWFKAQFFTEKRNDVVTTLGGLGKCDSPSPHPVNVDIVERQWIPSSDDKNFGTWKKEVTFSSAFELNCPPTFQTDIMSLNYVLELKVTFPGNGNDLEHKIPIVIRSGLTGAPPSCNPPDSDALPASQVLGLPSSYLNADNWDWTTNLDPVS